MDPLTDRLPPQNREAERALLGGILRDPHVLPEVLPIVRPESFYFDAHQKCFAAIADLAGQQKPVDLVLLHDELRRRKQVDDIGGAGYLAELWEAVPTGVNAAYHAKIVREEATRRALIHACNEILRDATDRTGTAEELVAQAGQKLLALGSGSGDAAPCPAGRAAREFLEALQERRAKGDALSGLSTGYEDLDRFTGGLQNGELIILAARPSLGKTAGSLNISRNVALSGHRVLFFSLEQSRREIAARLLSMESGVPMDLMSRPRDLGASDFDAMCDVTLGPHGALASLPLDIHAEPAMTASRVTAVARREALRAAAQKDRRRDVRLVVVDYLGMMSPENRRDNKNLQIGASALGMKALAQTLDVPVILLCQLNREAEHERRPPRLSDLRDSGEIEQHADRVLLLHRDPEVTTKRPGDAVWPIQVIIAKNRNGPIGDMTLAYRRPVLRFENAAVGY